MPAWLLAGLLDWLAGCMANALHACLVSMSSCRTQPAASRQLKLDTAHVWWGYANQVGYVAAIEVAWVSLGIPDLCSCRCQLPLLPPPPPQSDTVDAEGNQRVWGTHHRRRDMEAMIRRFLTTFRAEDISAEQGMATYTHLLRQVRTGTHLSAALASSSSSRCQQPLP
jgi:hypothetical protein